MIQKGRVIGSGNENVVGCRWFFYELKEVVQDMVYFGYIVCCQMVVVDGIEFIEQIDIFVLMSFIEDKLQFGSCFFYEVCDQVFKVNDKEW